jgi:bacillolysin/neutral peptidase B
MDLVSIVNTTCASDETPPRWANACWWNNRMWYGQTNDHNGRLVSMARFLDVVGHELTHGVINATAKLVYRNQSGALNESFADIFGILIANRYRAADPDDVSSWNWLIGNGLGDDGNALRDFADPASLGDPAHMDDYVATLADLGGVHVNSNIHNKAVHGLLTATDARGMPVLMVDELAIILYLALCHLPSLATFADAREKAREVAKVYLSADAERASVVDAAIAAAYDAVAIS